MFRQSKLKALVTNIAMQWIKRIEAKDVSDMLCTCKTQWYIMGMLIIITLGMLYLITNKIRNSSFFKGCLFSNNTKILLLVSNTHSYRPIKLCRVARSIHLFRIRGRLNAENVKLKKNWIWDVLEIDWSSITLNDNKIDLPNSVIIPFKERYRAGRPLGKHLLLFYIIPRKNDNSMTSDSGPCPSSPTEMEYKPQFFDEPECLSSEKENILPLESIATPSLQNLSLEEGTTGNETEATSWEASVAKTIMTTPRASSPFPEWPSTLEQLEP